MSEKEQKMASDYRHIVRVANVDLAGEKKLNIALTKIKGININLADAICNKTGIKKAKKAGNLNDDEVTLLDGVITDPLSNGLPSWLLNRRKDYESGEDKHLLGGRLNYAKENDIKRLKRIKSLRGLRHQKGLTVRGQRTKANFRKSRGKVVGVKKKVAPAKK